jgi:hypothetical protein
MRFQAVLEQAGKTATGVQVPDEVVEALGGGRRPKVVVMVNGFRFRSSIASVGGRFMLGVSAERRSAANVAAGDVLDVDVELDDVPREVDIPPDLAEALVASPEAAAFWETLSYSKKQWHVHQIVSAKQAETRQRRVVKSIALLREGKAR